MKVTIENKKGLNKDLKVFIDKKTIGTYMDDKYEEIKKTVVLKGFRPGKVPKDVYSGLKKYKVFETWFINKNIKFNHMNYEEWVKKY